MQIIDYVVHPEYLNDCKTRDKFLLGNDIALAVAEITDPRYRISSFKNQTDFNIPIPK